MTWDPTASRTKVALSIACASVGGIGSAVTAALASLGVLVSLTGFGLCTLTYRGVLLERYDEPLDCLAEPAWAFTCWFALVGVGLLLAFGALLVGSGRPAIALSVGAVLAATTVVVAVTTSGPLAPWWPWA